MTFEPVNQPDQKPFLVFLLTQLAFFPIFPNLNKTWQRLSALTQLVTLKRFEAIIDANDDS